MAKSKAWHYIDLSQRDSLVLVLGGNRYEVTQFNVTYARNEMPVAQVSVPLGRNVYTNQPGPIHSYVQTLNREVEAEILIRPSGDSGLVDAEGNNIPWPDEPHVIFKGYYSSYSHRRVNGQISIVIQLQHFLSRLADTSAFSSISHPSNPASLVYRSIVSPSLSLGAGGEGQATFLPQHVGFNEIRSLVDVDLWLAIKGLLCASASAEAWDPTNGKGCLDGVSLQTTEHARTVLSMIEGPTADCGKAYQLAKPLPLFNGGYSAVNDGVAESIAKLRFDSFANHTLWDMLVGYFTREFSLALIPLPDSAVVLADCPGFRTAYKSVPPDRQHAISPISLGLSKPIRAVALTTTLESRTGGSVDPLETTFGGCYISERKEDATGTVMIRSPTAWLQELSKAAYDPRETTRDIPTLTTPAPPPAAGEITEAQSLTANELFSRYAKQLYLENNLRTRTGSFSGPLRFDIAPGSHLRLVGSGEQFMGAEDSLAGDIYGEVVRVTISIDADAPAASTSFQLSHIRSAAEYNTFGTSSHPLYGDAVVAGLPLVQGLPNGE